MRRGLAAAVVGVMLSTAGPAVASTGQGLTVWESGGLSDSTLAAARMTATIEGGDLTLVDEGTVRLMSVTRDGEPVQRPAAGFGFPMAITAVPTAEAWVLDPELPEMLARGVVMGRRAAESRGARAGDRVVLEGWDGSLVRLEISGILPDARLEWAEVVVSKAVAEVLAFERPSTAVIRGVDPGTARRVFDGLAPDRPIRVGTLGRTVSFSDPTLPPVVLKERFGEFSFRPTGVGDAIEIEQEWLDANIVTVELPVLGVFRCNRSVVPYVRGAIAEMQRTGVIEGIDPVDFQIAGGCFNSRLMRGGDKGFALSRHAWGAAIDFNPSTNRYGEEVTLDPEIGAIMRRWGFAWGAGWTVPDGMHFEWTHIPSIGSTCPSIELRAPGPGQGPWRIDHLAASCAAGSGPSGASPAAG